MSLKDKIKRRRAIVALYPDEAIALEVEAAEEAVEAAKAAKGDRMASKALREAEKARDEVRARAEATVLEVELQALPRKDFAELFEGHPPRDGMQLDQRFGINWNTFLGEALPKSVAAVRTRSTGEPVEVAASEWGDVVEEITEGQYQTLTLSLLALNKDPANPF